MKKTENIKIILISALALVFAVLSVCMFAAVHTRSEKLTSQYEAERWAGDGEGSFKQFTVFIPSTESLDLKGIYEFRYKMLDAFEKASLDEPETGYLFTDAWSTADKLTVLTDRAKTTAKVIAVGGDFFSFHQPYLLSGSYFSDNDLNDDLVVIDKELAWLLYGGYDLQGMLIYINNRPFTVAGVVDGESDFELSSAGTDDMCLFMSYDAYTDICENPTVTTYEVVMPEAYTGFSENILTSFFASDRYEIVQNTARFSFSKLLTVLKTFSQRSVRNLPTAFPYWENAARIAEDKAAVNIICGITAACAAAAMFAAAVVSLILKKRKKPADDKAAEGTKFAEADGFTADRTADHCKRSVVPPEIQSPEIKQEETFDI